MEFDEKLHNLSIFALRELARRIGVPSPTSKKKNALIDEIIAISQGKKQPVSDTNKKGRPPKGIGYEFATLINQTDRILTDIAEKNLSTTLTMCQDIEPFSYDESKIVEGYVDLSNGATLWVNDKFSFARYNIDVDLLNTNELRPGDFLSAELSIKMGKPMITKIYTINGMPEVTSKDRIKFEEIAHVLPNTSYKFSSLKNLKILKGEIAYFYGENNNDNTIKIFDIIKNNDADAKIYINLSLAEKNKIYLNDIDDVEMFVSDFVADETFQKQILSLAIERAKRLLEIGKNVIVAIDDLSSIYFVDISLTKEILNSTKCGNNGGSISLLAIASKATEQFEKLADKKFDFEKIN